MGLTRVQLSTLALLFVLAAGLAADKPNQRRPANDTELRYWLENMIVWHGYSDAEVSDATGMTAAEVAAARRRLAIDPAAPPKRPDPDRLLVLPYPGGRHPRIGFLEGAVRPQRETKVSVFPPWKEGGYVIVDVPEAIWSNLGLTYLAHTHVPTVWTKQSIELPPLEWQRLARGQLQLERKLPNGIVYRASVTPERYRVDMGLQLTNGTTEPLRDLRVQNCVMLARALGFEEQSNANKVFRAPYAACRSRDGKRWIITGWSPCHRSWGNEKCPCLHADPKFPDCAPGQSQVLRGVLWFYEGTDLDAELKRMEATGWERKP
jgi:hypothetical protein